MAAFTNIAQILIFWDAGGITTSFGLRQARVIAVDPQILYIKLCLYRHIAREALTHDFNLILCRLIFSFPADILWVHHTARLFVVHQISSADALILRVIIRRPPQISHAVSPIPPQRLQSVDTHVLILHSHVYQPLPQPLLLLSLQRLLS